MNTFLQTKEAITAWLDQHFIKIYELIPDETYGYVVNVSGDVDLASKKLSHIPVKFAHVSGNFYCYANQLTCLEFCPTHVGGGFYCDQNQLTSLEFSPSHVGDHFSCSNNKLTSLKFSPNYIGGSFYCGHNQLTSLKFCPTHVGGDFFSCNNNPLPEKIKNITDFNVIYQEHLKEKISLVKERLDKKILDQSMVSSQSKMKI